MLQPVTLGSKTLADDTHSFGREQIADIRELRAVGIEDVAIGDHPQTVFPMKRYVPDGLNGNVNVVPPAIDPLAPKNMALSPDDAASVCGRLGIDVDRLLPAQVSRSDPWKDPVGVIDAYRLIEEERPDVQLALVGSMASDDPEGWDCYDATVASPSADGAMPATDAARSAQGGAA